MKYLKLTLMLIAMGIFIPNGECLRTSPDAKTPEEASSKAEEDLTELIRERDLSKREADKRIREKEQAAAKRAETVRVRVHSGGADPLSKSSEVILTTEMTKEQLKTKDFKEVHRQARESRLNYARTQSGPPAEVSTTKSTADESEETPGGSSTTGLILLGALGLGGFWYFRQQNIA